MIGWTYRCPEAKCREACEQRADEWVHTVDGSPACGIPERFEVAPHKMEWSGRLWRIEEARQAMRREAANRASAIVSKMNPKPHCGDCAAGLRLSIAGEIEKAWEESHAWAQDEYLRPHPVRPLVAAT